MTINTDLLLAEYREINQHLRYNIQQFVNWFSFFLIFSFISIGIFSANLDRLPNVRGLGLVYPTLAVFLILHILAFFAIITFRRYISVSNKRVERIIALIGEEGASPIPARFCQWMTHFMGAGFVISYFTWFSLVFILWSRQ
ncbi:MAG TPA: hypothetical protein VJ779_03480 [Acetobacteraceae bacterium]|jgi:hypothetical protein|nr:hypothetical protein [Acetobacteraceae bacterium]